MQSNAIKFHPNKKCIHNTLNNMADMPGQQPVTKGVVLALEFSITRRRLLYSGSRKLSQGKRWRQGNRWRQVTGKKVQ